MYAIIRDGSRQFRVEKGAEIEFDLKGAKEGDPVEFPEVLLLNDGSETKIGTPTVAGVKVVGEVVGRVRGPKLRIFRFRRREGFHKAKGHRQKHTLVKITEIVAK